LAYFARDYGLEQLAIEFEGKVPTPKHLQKVVETAKAWDIHIVLVQMEFDKENAEILAKETNSKIVRIDPLDYNWPEQIISMTEKLSNTPQ
jgi:zinc transport system substrate-binding protein